MTDKAKAARTRIDATKPLTTAERMRVLRLALVSHHVAKALATELTAMGYEPMMFSQALAALLEEPRP